MSDGKPGFLAQLRSFPKTFWVANTMEIFERLSWYGWFTVMALYVTAPPENGGLGFTTEVRGALQGAIPFILYLLPVLTGALAERFGFKKMFIIAYLVMIVSYYSLGQFTSLSGFATAFLFVAIGAAIFKPVVVGTVARVTDESNSAIGFGIFYMMVNVGGFVGPEMTQVVAQHDSLAQRLPARLKDLVPQFGLPDEDDLDESLAVPLPVPQEADLLQRCGGQVLRLVQNQGHQSTASVHAHQVLLQLVDDAELVCR